MHWRKLENEHGFPFYFNEACNIQQWDHPNFYEITQRLDECNYVKYSSYRVALKFRMLQQILFMDQVSLSIVIGVFDRNRLGSNESTLCLESCDLEAVISDIFFASNKQNHTNTDIDLATELMLNLLYNIFDKERKGKIQVSCAKVVLGLLSNCTYQDFNKFLFLLSADHNNCVTRLKLQNLLAKITDITRFMHEDANYGQHLVNISVEQCYKSSPGLVGINESTFILWLEKNPQLLTWLPLLYRLKISETVVDPQKCSCCKTSPLIGLRYNCMKCSHYIQCQRCFFTGKTSNKHKLSHSMREFCSEEEAKDIDLNCFTKLWRVLNCSSQNNNQTQVSIIDGKSNDSDLKNQSELCSVQPLSSPENQLHSIIRQLEMQNRHLQQVLLLGNHNEKDLKKCLEEHKNHIGTQIQKLKLLKDSLNCSLSNSVTTPCRTVKNVESTPMIGCNMPQRGLGLNMLSPISQSTNNTILNYENDNYTNNKINSAQETWFTVNDDSRSKTNGGYPTESMTYKKSQIINSAKQNHNDLDDALAKLQQILANNFSLDESLGNIDNGQLKFAVSEVEGVLSSFIDTVESSKASTRASSSVQLYSNQKSGDVTHFASVV